MTLILLCLDFLGGKGVVYNVEQPEKRKRRKFATEEERRAADKESKKRSYHKRKDANREKKNAGMRKRTKENNERVNELKRQCYQRTKNDNKERKKAQNRARNAIYREKNKERLKINYRKNSKKYRESHPEKIKKILNDYYHKRTKQDLGYKLGLNIRQKTYREVTRSLKTTKNGRFNKLSGCSYGQLKDYIVTQFSEGMTVDNYGTFWNLDHIIPVSFAEGCPTALRVLSHYTNLRPMLCQDNLKKSNNCDLQLVSPEYEYLNPFL